MWPLLYLPKGRTLYDKLDYWSTDLASMFRELAEQDFTGSLEIVSLVQRGLFIWHHGRLCNAFYEGDDEKKITRLEVLRHFLQKGKRGQETLINIMELDPRLTECLGALEIKPPIYRELETSFIDMTKLFETLNAKRFLGVLRFYHVRSHTRLGNILLKMNKITRDQLQQAVRLQLSHQGALRLGDALVQIGAIELKDLGSALDLQSHARKGSDIELALAVFWEGQLLGGYTYILKVFKTDWDEILPQLVGTEVLMDMVEGLLPEPLDIRFLWNEFSHETPASVEKIHQASLHPVSEALPSAKPVKDESLNLKADDLILDLAGEPLHADDDFLTMDEEFGTTAVEAPAVQAAPVPQRESEKPADAPPVFKAPEVKPTPAKLPVVPSVSVPAALPVVPQPEVPVLEKIPAAEAGPTEPGQAAGVTAENNSSGPDLPESMPNALPVPGTPVSVPAAEPAISESVQGVEYVLRVAHDFMGPFGKSLLKKEAAPLLLQGRNWPDYQVRELTLRFFRSATWVLGKQKSGQMLQKIRERIEV